MRAITRYPTALAALVLCLASSVWSQDSAFRQLGRAAGVDAGGFPRPVAFIRMSPDGAPPPAIGSGAQLTEQEQAYWITAVGWAFENNGGGRMFNPMLLEDYRLANGASFTTGAAAPPADGDDAGGTAREGNGLATAHIVALVPPLDTVLIYESDCDLVNAPADPSGGERCKGYTATVFEVSYQDRAISLRGAISVEKGQQKRLDEKDPAVQQRFLDARRVWLEKGKAIKG